MHEDRAAVDVHVQFQLLFEQVHVLWPIHSGLGGVQYRPTAPRHDMAPHIIWLGGSFTLATTYFLSKRLLNGSLMYT